MSFICVFLLFSTLYDNRLYFGPKKNLNKVIIIQIIQNMLSYHNVIKLEISNRKVSENIQVFESEVTL